MSGFIDAMKKVAEAEVSKLHISELGVVTSVFPHSTDGDNDNYECNVKLKDLDVELRKVPVATSHIGLVHVPHVGDLVLLTFVNGDINSPIIIGSLYNDEDRPPTSKSEEMVYKPPYSKNTQLRRVYLDFPEDDVTITVQDDQIRLHVGKSDISIDGNGVSVQTKLDVTIKSDGDLSIKANSIKLESEQETQLTANAKMTIKGATVDINP
jgi:uncharacterized protein involved in type VI secretion and phage assembly